MQGNGTQESPYIITSWSKLEELSDHYYDNENAYIAFDPDAENKVIDMTENPVTKRSNSTAGTLSEAVGLSGICTAP